MDYEGRGYMELVRHLPLPLVVLRFVATHAERLQGKDPEVTAEQVCRTLNLRCGAAFCRQRGVPEVRH